MRGKNTPLQGKEEEEHTEEQKGSGKTNRTEKRTARAGTIWREWREQIGRDIGRGQLN